MGKLRDATALTIAIGAALALAACTSTPLAPPTSGAQHPASVQTPYSVTVLDDGTGPEMCFFVLTSYPPQCGGPVVLGWNWDDWAGQYEEASGVRWGEFWLAGTFDPEAQTFTVVEAGPPRDRPTHPLPDFSTACPEPEGGWRVLDVSRTTQEALDATLRAAEGLVGYAGAWLDQSPNPYAAAPWPQEGTEEEKLAWELGMNDPQLLILNVRTTGDIAAVEAALRKHWGGMLCVSGAPHTEAELLRIQREIHQNPLLAVGSYPDVKTGMLQVEAIWDDGSLQQQMDATYGPGVVKVTSTLIPWEG